MNIRSITLIGILSASLTAAKLTLAAVANVELVTFLLMMYTLTIGTRKTMVTALVFVTTEMLIFGFGTWVIGYYVIWLSIVLITGILKKRLKTEYPSAILSMLFGLLFGAAFAINESLFYGFAYGFTYWLRGIPFDLVHAASNFVIMLVLFNPIKKVLTRLTHTFR